MTSNNFADSIFSIDRKWSNTNQLLFVFVNDGHTQTIRINLHLHFFVCFICSHIFLSLSLSPHTNTYTHSFHALWILFFCCTAPAIRIVDEQGNEIRDRYYKIGSTIDLTCQVATAFIKNNTGVAPEPNILLQYQQQHNSLHHTAVTSPQPVATNSVRENEIDVTDKSRYNGGNDGNILHRRIVWKKDNLNVTKDAHFNLRFVRNFRSPFFCHYQWHICLITF